VLLGWWFKYTRVTASYPRGRRHRYSGFIGKLGENKTSGRFRRKWLDNIKMGLTEIG